MTTTLTRPAEEVEAAELEGFLEVGNMPHLAGLYWAYKTQRAAAAAANKIKGRLANRILASLKEHEATCFTIGGQPVMRKQVVKDTVVLDSAKVKAKYPEIWLECSKTKKGTIKVWVRPQDGDDASEEDED